MQAEVEQQTTRRGSREWHRRGIRRPSLAVIKVQGDGVENSEEGVQTLEPSERVSENLEVTLRRKQSKLLHISHPLYQEYSHQALDREIRRQQRRTEEGTSSPESVRRSSRGPSLLQRPSLTQPLGLWRDMPEVRASGCFETLSPGQQKLQEVKFELISSEASYLRSLDIAVDHFLSSEKLHSLLNPQQRQWLFSKLAAVRDVSRRFLADLEEMFEENFMDFDVCGILLRHLPDFCSVYVPYVTNQSYQEKIFKQLIQTNPQFLRAVESLESHPMCQRLTLKSFLILPFQRATRLRLLVQNILQRSTPGSVDEENARRAAEGLGELMRNCNENVRRMKSTEELIALSSLIDFESKMFPLVSQSRRLIKHGAFEIERANTTLLWRKGSSRTLYLHLFNDCILLSRQRENGRFAVFDHTTSQNLMVENIHSRTPGVARYLFLLTVVQNHRGKFQEFLLKAHTQSEKLRWISALTPIKQEFDLREHYNSKQTQCLKPYKAREYDELQLQKADILIVTQECADGWEEGFRLSDGDRGWFPSSHVEPIASHHSRVRNIEERLRLSMKAVRTPSPSAP